jgi:S-adenosylmethionine decarboxylase
VLADEFYVFPNGAVTGVLLLAQSHLSIHTWPELLLANIDLLTYGDVDAEAVLDVLQTGLGAERLQVFAVARGGA